MITISGFTINRDIKGTAEFVFPKRFGIEIDNLRAECIHADKLIFLLEMFIADGIQTYEDIEWIGLVFEGSRHRVSEADLPDILAAALHFGILEPDGEGWKLGGVLKRTGGACS